MSKPLNRRQFLEGAASGAALLSLAGPAAAQAPTGAASFNIPSLVDGQRFDPALVVDAARALAQRPLIPLAINDLPEGYATLPADQYAVMTEPEPIMAPSPIVTGATSEEFEPTKALAPIVVLDLLKPS